MFTKLFILLTFYHFLDDSVDANESQCASLLVNNLTEQTQSSVVVALIKNAQILLDGANKYAAIQTRCPVVESVCEKPMDCSEIKEKNPLATSGVYKIWLRSRMISGSTNVYCDMEDDGGAWTVIQRRGDFDSGQEYFYKDWKSYKSGFGDLMKDFWLGNDNIFALTNQRASVVKLTLADWEGNTTYVTYDKFWIDDELRNYTLHVSGYRGTAGDSLSYHNGQAFSTKDRANDKEHGHCAVECKGAWWYGRCYQSNLNGLYLKNVLLSTKSDGIIWSHFRSNSLKESVIKIQPQDFQKKPQ